MSATRSWTVWGLGASVTVTDSGLAEDAERLVRAEVSDVDLACSRFRNDSELMRLQLAPAPDTRMSALLSLLVAKALDAAQWTDGDVDPTLGRDMEALGYDRDIAHLRLGADGAVAQDVRPRAQTPGWLRVRLEGQTLLMPADLRLDLGATAKAVAADRAAGRVAAELGCGALVSLGGDIATAGDTPDGGWQVLVQDLPTDPWQQVTLRAGRAMATSSTQKRRWQHGGTLVHHILDPRFGLPAEPVWRSVTVAATTCFQANTFSTAGIVRGFAARQCFDRIGVAARLVDRQGRVYVTGDWPRDGFAGAREEVPDSAVPGVGADG